MTDYGSMTVRNVNVRINAEGLMSFLDIWKLSGKRKMESPVHWQRSNNALIIETHEKYRGKEPGYKISRVLKTASTENGGYWGHPVLAVSYAASLSPKLAVEINETWLRFKRSDVLLADEILSKASIEDNRWAATRALSRVKRNEYTTTLKNHGVVSHGYANCTNEIYKALQDDTAKNLRKKKDISKSANLRDHFDTDELIAIMFAESLAGNRIEAQDSRGNKECISATKKSAQRVRKTIDEDRRDHQLRLG